MELDEFLDGGVYIVTLSEGRQIEVYRVGGALFEVGAEGTSIPPHLIESIDY